LTSSLVAVDASPCLVFLDLFFLEDNGNLAFAKVYDHNIM